MPTASSGRLDAASYPHDDLAATGDQGQNLSLIGAALQADTGICGIVGLGNPGANPAAKYVGDNNLKVPVATFDVGAEAAKRIKAALLPWRSTSSPSCRPISRSPTSPIRPSTI